MERTLVSLALPPDRGPLKYETFWAERLGDATAKLLNSSYLLPLAVGDVVSVAARDHRVVLTGLVEPGPMTLAVTPVANGVTADERRVVAEGWNHLGAVWTEGARDVLTTVWDPDVTPDDVFAITTSSLRARHGWGTPLVYSSDERGREMRTLF